MSPAQLEKRLGEVEVEVAKLVPPIPAPEWMAWLTDDELTTMLSILDRAGATKLDELPDADQLRMQSIALAAQARMIEAQQ
jgi:hypothetical protein